MFSAKLYAEHVYFYMLISHNRFPPSTSDRFCFLSHRKSIIHFVKSLSTGCVLLINSLNLCLPDPMTEEIAYDNPKTKEITYGNPTTKETVYGNPISEEIPNATTTPRVRRCDECFLRTNRLKSIPLEFK